MGVVIQLTSNLFINLFTLMNSGIHSNKIELPQSDFPKNGPGASVPQDDLKNINNSLEVMKNRINLLRMQLKKQKDSISKHKSLTEQTIKKKIQFNKLYKLKNKDTTDEDQKLSQLKSRNYSYREGHRNQMNNIMKAIYLVKLDQARQIKNTSLQLKKRLEQREGEQKVKYKERKKMVQQQSERAKKRYVEYFKQKLNSIYANQMQQNMNVQQMTEQRKKQFTNLKEEEQKILNQIHQIRQKSLDAKKQYLAALSLQSKEVATAFEEKKYMPTLVTKPENSRYKQQKEDFFSKDPMVSIMSSRDLKIPKASINTDKFQIILKELKKLDKQQKKE